MAIGGDKLRHFVAFLLWVSMFYFCVCACMCGKILSEGKLCKQKQILFKCFFLSHSYISHKGNKIILKSHWDTVADLYSALKLATVKYSCCIMFLLLYMLPVSCKQGLLDLGMIFLPQYSFSWIFFFLIIFSDLNLMAVVHWGEGVRGVNGKVLTAEGCRNLYEKRVGAALRQAQHILASPEHSSAHAGGFSGKLCLRAGMSEQLGRHVSVRQG